MVEMVLKLTLGLFVKKARSGLGSKLKDGGLNSQQLRDLIISKLEKVKTEVVGLARGNLLSSASFIHEGLGILDDLVDKSDSLTLSPEHDVNDCKNSSRADNTDLQASLSGSNSVIELVGAINKIKINSSDHFESAMKLFDKANTNATEAFHNEALSIEYRILAAKLRVQSRLLLSLENPCLASQPCRLYLEELHGLASVVKMFRNDLEGGMLSFLNRKKRHKLVLSVSAINFVVFKFLKSFTRGPVNLYDWSILKRGDWTYNPLIPDKTICLELQSAGIEFSNFKVLLSPKYERDVLVNSWSIRVTDPKLFNPSLSGTRSLIDLGGCILHLYDSEERLLDRTGAGYYPGYNTLVPTSDGIALLSHSAHVPDNIRVAFYKNENGKIKGNCIFETKLWDDTLVAVTNKYRIAAIEKSGHLVRVYEKDGPLIREFELYGGKCESCVSIAFNFITEELVFVSRVESWYFLSTYEPEIGTRRHNVRLSLFGKKDRNLRLTTHCCGPMVLVSDKYALHIQ